MSRVLISKIQFQKLVWDATLVGSLFWLLFLIPISLVFSQESRNFIIGLDLVLSVYYWFDSAYRLRKIKKGRNFSKLDIIALVPFYSLATLIGVSSPFLILLLGLRFCKVPSAFVRAKKQMASLMLPNWVKTIGFFGIILGVIHCLACGWLLIEPMDAPDQITAYNKALYWAITTLTTIGYGDITPTNNYSRIYTMIIMLTGVGFYGLVIAQVSSLLINRDKRKEQQVEKMRSLTSFLKHYKVPTDIQHEVFSFYKHLINKNAEDEETKILSELPLGLQKEIITYMNIKPLNGVVLFKNVSFQCKKDAANLFEHVFYEPGDHIIHSGELGQNMYIIGHGIVDVKIKGETLAQLKDGQCFGEMALIEDSPRVADIVANTYCDVYVLSKTKFHQILESHEDLRKNVDKIVTDRNQKAS